MRHPISLRLLTSTLVVFGPVGSIEAVGPSTSPAPALSNPQMTATLMRLPLQFEANQGQVDEQVTFLARGTGYRLFLTPSESVLVLQQREPSTKPAQRKRGEPIARSEPLAIKQAVVRMKLEGANSTPAVEGKEHLPGIVNYFIGNDPAKWRTNIPTYAKVQYQEVYPGIDLAYYGNQGTVEYDFIVAPGADPDQIRLAFEGASDIHVADGGDLLLATALGEVRVQKPVVYQLEPDGHKTLVAGHYIVERQVPDALSTHSLLTTDHSPLPHIGIQLAAYDQSKPGVIDPVLLYSTYLGGSGGDGGNGIAVDGTGQAYVTGNTGSTNFPTATPLQATLAGEGDVFVTKLNAAGTALLYSTYLGGSSGDEGRSIAVDGAGQAHVTGLTNSSDFPTATPFQAANAGMSDAFVATLNAAGTALRYSTYFGGGDLDAGNGIAVDGAGQAYVTGYTWSGDFPTATPFQGANAGVSDAFVATFNAAGTALRYSTYLGGSEGGHHVSGYDEGRGIAIDGAGQAYVTGLTSSLNFPTATPFSTSLGDHTAVFVTKLNATGTVLLFSTYLAGSLEQMGNAIAVDGAGHAYVTGWTSSEDFPTATPFQATIASVGCCQIPDAFVTKFNAAGTALLYSTYLGGSGGEDGRSIAVDGVGNAYVTGGTDSPDFPTTTPLQAALNGGGDVFVTTLNAAGTALLSSTYLGGSGGEGGNGIAVDGASQVYVTGVTNSSDFSTATPLQAAFAGESDAFVAKLSASVTNQPPVCRAAQASPAVLWAPNHQFVPIAILGVTDPDKDAVTITATGVTQDEPVNAKGDGNTSPDAMIHVGAASVRAERAGGGNGRVYHIAFTADDGHGNSCSGAVTVGVPHSQKKGLTAIDDGQLYTSTIP